MQIKWVTILADSTGFEDLNRPLFFGVPMVVYTV